MTRQPSTYLTALAEALAPLADAVLAKSLPAAFLVTAAKLSCIHAAVRNLPSTGKGKPNVSRIAAITGLTRNKIASLLQPELSIRPKESPVQAVLRGWTTDPSLRLTNGRPSDLNLQGRAESLHFLVRKYGRDVTPAAVLAELERTHKIARLKTGKSD